MVVIKRLGSAKVRQAKGVMRKEGYEIKKRPYELNIVGIRADSTVPNSFDDTLLAFCKDEKGKYFEFEFPVTTDPSLYYLNNPLNVDGTALLLEGQYDYKLGLHKGSYKALIQDGDVDISRNASRKGVLDFNGGKKYTGRFGINVHKSGSKGTTDSVGRYSAGCTSFANADDYKKFIQLVERSKDLYGNKFKYTLIDNRARKRALLKRVVIGTTIVSIIAVGVYLFKKGKLKF